MKALLLVGGFGTRLRPLTLNKPKPLIDFANKPMIIRQIENLAKAGVDHIILAVNYKSYLLETFLKPYEEKLNIKITISLEEEPLGTAGPLALAKDILSSSEEPFFVLNTDIICNYPFSELKEFHASHGKEGTILVTEVENSSSYGVLIASSVGEVIQFVEKPSTFVSNLINAGIYVLNPSILNRIELKPTSIEKEIFPFMVHDKELHCMKLNGYWMDVGKPEDYLIGLEMFLAQLDAKTDFTYSNNFEIIEPVLIDPTAKIGNNCVIGPGVSIGQNVVINEGVRINRSSILEGVHIDSYSWINSSIIGWNCRIGRWCRVTGISVLGKCVVLQENVYINGAKILSHKSISSDIPFPEVIM